jgi:hypothetical protein
MPRGGQQPKSVPSAERWQGRTSFAMRAAMVVEIAAVEDDVPEPVTGPGTQPENARLHAAIPENHWTYVAMSQRLRRMQVE